MYAHDLQPKALYFSHIIHRIIKLLTYLRIII